MTMLDYTSPAVAPHRKRLTRGQFEQICLRAARNKTICDQYIRRVLTHLCRWLEIPDHFKNLSPTGVTIRENTQAMVIALYQLLEKRCKYDFDVAEVLNSCSEEPDES